MIAPEPTVADLQTEAAALILQRFDENSAWQLGNILVALAQNDALGIVINIRCANRTLFHACTPRSAAQNDNWARRKSNTALMFAEASLLVGTRNRARAQTLRDQGFDDADFSDHGGAVPIVVNGVGMVAVVTVSGLPQREDHALVVVALRQLMG